MYDPTFALPYRTLQIADSGAPTGGFVHSNGLEELFRSGVIGDVDDLLFQLQAFVRESVPGRELSFLHHAWMAALDTDLDRLELLVRERLITRTTASARAAEKLRGAALRRILARAFDEDMGKVWDAADGSHAVLFGVAGFADGASRRVVITAYAYSLVAGIARAAVRLGRVTPSEAEYVICLLYTSPSPRDS